MGAEARQAAPDRRVAYQILGRGSQRIWGREVDELLERLLRRAGLVALPIDAADSAHGAAPFPDDGRVLLFRGDHFFDRTAVRLMLANPQSALVAFNEAGHSQPLAVSCVARDAARWRALIVGAPLSRAELPQGYALIDAASAPSVFEDQVRKRSRPLILPANDATRGEIERRSFELAYKGVTDLVTKYVFPRPAFHATRLAAQLGIHPNAITAFSLLLVFAVLYLFARGDFALGIALGFAMSFLDTVDGKLARVTQTSSAFGNYFDHVIDMVHPPLWWLAWWWGASLALEPAPAWWDAAGFTVVAGYVALRLLEWSFIATFGVRIHTWRRWDSRFRLISSRRNPNLILLAAATLGGRPDLGLAAVAAWTLGSIAIHAVRWAQAWLETRRSGPLRSWIEEASAG